MHDAWRTSDCERVVRAKHIKRKNHNVRLAFCAHSFNTVSREKDALGNQASAHGRQERAAQAGASPDLPCENEGLPNILRFVIDNPILSAQAGNVPSAITAHTIGHRIVVFQVQ